MVSVAKLCSSVHPAVGDRRLPASRDEDVVQRFPGSAIWAVPRPVMDLFPRKPGVSNTEAVMVAEEEEAVTIVVCCPVDEGGADRWAE